ncbi:hypothetical protein D3C80_743030 [compost metagenome]
MDFNSRSALLGCSPLSNSSITTRESGFIVSRAVMTAMARNVPSEISLASMTFSSLPKFGFWLNAKPNKTSFWVVVMNLNSPKGSSGTCWIKSRIL